MIPQPPTTDQARVEAHCPCGSTLVIQGELAEDDREALRDWEDEHADCVAEQEPPTDTRLADAVTALVEVKKILGEVFGDQPSEARGKVISAAYELAKLGNVRLCDVPWCRSREPDHSTHRYEERITAQSGIEFLGVGAEVELSGSYENEIFFRAWYLEEGKVAESVLTYLTVEQARAAIPLIELAIARREELRGAVL